MSHTAETPEMLQSLLRLARACRDRMLPRELPPLVREQVAIDRQGLPAAAAPNGVVLDAAVAWLCRAQDCSATADGGVARAFHLEEGWQSSYPETTGYIVPTFLALAEQGYGRELEERALRMLDWLLRIQMESGAFQGGRVDEAPVAPTVFNTGQILLGLAAGARRNSRYLAPMINAADWLVDVQDGDGCWRKFHSPFVDVPADKTYDTHVAWGLLEAARIEPNRGYAEAALANVRWALTHMRGNGWMARCCLYLPGTPLTHTLGYALRGIVESYRYSRDMEFLDAACRMADGLLGAMGEDGRIPGTLDQDWRPGADYVCLTGSAQIAACWLLLFQETGHVRYREAALRANGHVCRTVKLSGIPELRGGVKGSFPVDGRYSQYEYPNWAAKFLIDSLLMERALQQGMPAAAVA